MLWWPESGGLPEASVIHHVVLYRLSAAASMGNMIRRAEKPQIEDAVLGCNRGPLPSCWNTDRVSRQRPVYGGNFSQSIQTGLPGMQRGPEDKLSHPTD